MTSIGNCSPELLRLGELVRKTDTLVVGAGAGLSAAAGLTYSGPRFERLFPDFIQKYGLRDMYSAGFYPFPTPEEFWAYWSRHILYNRYEAPLGRAFLDLYELVREKDYFVVTTNVDHCFQKAGFEKARLFYTQGDYGLFQCSVPCHQQTYQNDTAVRRMAAEQRDQRVPSELLPRCPRCGEPMSVNLRCDDRFVQDEGWYDARERYESFLNRHTGHPVLYLELGVGGNTPSIIKYPFWRLTAGNPFAHYACVNLFDAFAPPELGRRAVCVEENLADALEKLVRLAA